MNPNRKTLATLLNLVLLLSLILALAAPALGQGSGDSNETLSTTAEQHMAPAADPPPIDCNNSPAGQHAQLGGDDEIFVSFMDANVGLKIDKLDNDGTSPDLLVEWGWRDYGAYRNLVIYPMITTADLDGDGKDEVVSSFMDSRSYLQSVSLKNPEANKEDLAFDYLEDGTHTWHDYNSWWASIDIAAGNLDAARGDGDAAEEVAVAFSDRNHDLNLVLLDGESDGGISSWPTEWKSTDHGRGNANSVNVAVGDLDGDGHDNEIVLAIVDGYNNLQVIILKIESGGMGIHEIGWNSWTDDDRGNIDPVGEHMSVTTGDFDLDGKDEIAVAFRDGSNALQIGTIAYEPDGETLQDRVVARGWWRNTNNRRSNVFYVSAASADIDGDTRDEIVVAFEDSGGHLQMVTFDAQYAVPRLRGSLAAGTISGGVSVDAGDIDKDGRAEVVVAVRGNPGPIVISYDDPGLAEGANRDDLQSGLVRRDKWTGGNSNKVHPSVDVALGDVNDDSLYGDYTTTCQRIQEAHVMAMINLPPYWQELNPTDNQVAYGKSISGGQEEGKEVGSTFGSSMTLSAGFELEGFEVGASFGTDYEQSLSRSWTHGSSTTTENGWNAGEGFVAYKDLTYYVYQYKRTGGSDDELARVSVPVDHETDTKLFSVWNRSENGGRDLFPTTWVPAYRTAWKDQQAIASLSSYFASDDLFWGEGADAYDFNGNGTPDYLFAVIAGVYNGGNNVFYRIGYDVLADGIPQTYSSWIPIWHSVGWYSSGLGAAVTELNGNDTPELVVAWVDNPSGANSANYRVCWDLAADGKFSSCSGKKQIPGDIGSSTQGAGLEIVDLNGNGQPEMLFGWIDNLTDANKGYYRVGWNLDANGDSSDWWTNPKEIEGAFGTKDAGLGLTVDDMDGNGQLDLIAAWVRDQKGNNDWAYTVGEDLDGNANVDSWAPGHRIPGWVGDKTAAASLASADIVVDASGPELIVGWIDNPSGDKKAYSRVGKYWELFGGEVNQRPTDLKDDKADDGQFEIRLQDQWWNVDGKLLWRWDETPGNEAIKVSVGGANPTWSVTKDQYGSQTEETSESYSFTVGGEAKVLGIGVEASETWGFEEGHSYTVSWDKGFYMEGQSQALPGDAPFAKEYKYIPFTYMQQAKSKTGVDHAYMVLDYYVTYPLPLAAASPAANGTPAFVAGITPCAPLIESPTHLDSDAWYSTNTATFTWMQPEGDPAVVDGYRWYMDHEPDTVPSAFSQNLMNAATYEDLSDGLWYLHLRARGDGGDWSETAHRSVRVDLHPPQVEINPDLPYPAHNGGWYNKPVTLSVDATDPSTSSGQAGSGVQAVEFSTDGVTWQPYTTPLVFDTDTPLTTLRARATDLVGHVSEPVSITFGVDLTAPTSVVQPGCWEPGGVCVADVLTDEMGNEYMQLAGEVNGGLSGLKGLGIQISGEDTTSTDEAGDGTWSWIPSTELGVGCHAFYIWAEDGAGNVEPVHSFGTEVVWHPREQPNLSGSSFWATATELRPGDTVDFVMDLRNSGWQETWVPVEVSLPAGLQVLPDTILGGGQYDPDTRTITWPPRYLWPGGDQHLAFSAQVDAAQPTATLDVTLNGLGTWPITESCPPEVLPRFSELETAVEMTATVTVDPELPAGADVVPPTVLGLGIEEGVATNARDVQLRIDADGDARWMYLREWTWSANEGTWVVAQESGWLPYSASHPWTLSEGDGVKYLGAWLADAAGNVSALDRRSLAFTNLMGPRQFLADGERIQYRFPLFYRQLAVFNVVAHEGNPDLYVWQPRSGFRPQYAATGTGFVDTVGFQAVEGGLYLVEVKAEGDAVYQLLLAGDIGPKEATASSLTASPPEHPLTVSNPLSAGAAVAPSPPASLKLYLPLVIRNQ